MTLKLNEVWGRFSLAQRYMVASLVVLLFWMASVGWWISREIEAGVVHESATTTALYMNSFVAPLTQELTYQPNLHPENVAKLNELIHETPLGRNVVSFKIWSPEGRVVYAADPALIGQVFPVGDNATMAWQGMVSSEISDLEDPEHAGDREFGTHLLETYSPIHRRDSEDIIAVAEFYQTVDTLDAQLARARLSGWLVIGFATLVAYLALAGIVRSGSDTIARQQRELRDKVRQLTALLAQNRRLSERVQRAATGTAARNESVLRRISAELHDGPAQALGLALLRLDAVMAHAGECHCDKASLAQASADLDIIQTSLRDAMDEIRELSSGLTLPELGDLNLRETIARVVRSHEQRTGTRVEVSAESVPENTSLPAKITIYRVIQEALHNAYRHAGGEGQHVRVDGRDGRLAVEISDRGPGFDCADTVRQDGHLGIEGMRQRVESIGGTFSIESAAGRGTRVIAELPLQPAGVEA